MRWGDTLDDSDGEEGAVPVAAPAARGPAAAQKKIQQPLPPPQVVGPDSEGVTTYLEWRRNEKGERVKSVRKIKRSMQQKRVSAKVLARRDWKLFGGAVGVRDEDMISMVSTESIVLESVKRATKEEEASGEMDAKPADGMEGLVGSNASLLVCRICGKKGDHWTSKCPYKDLAGAGGLGGKPGEEEGSRPAGKFVVRAAGANLVGESMRSRRDENSIRVNNLSEDTTERDLHDLFSPFGAVSRVYIAYDRETKESRGFAFVNFERREEGQRAINKLDGYGFDSLILRVEWAQPREPRPAGM